MSDDNRTMELTRLAATGSEDATLRDVVAPLEGTVLRVVHGGRGLEAGVSAITILDRTDPETMRAGALVLAVGVEPSRGEAIELVDRAGRAGAAGIVLRGGVDLAPRIADVAAASDLLVLSTPDEMQWGQLYSLLVTATSTRGAARGTGTTGVPVGDLFALANAVALAVDAPVTIEDAQWRVLAYSNLDQPIDDARRQTILGRIPPAEWQKRLEQAGVLRGLRSGDVVRFEHDGLAPRLAAPVRAGSEMLGAIWIAEGDRALGETVADELARAAQHAAVHLIAHRASEDVVRRARGALVRELLAGRLPAGAAGTPPLLQRRGALSVAAFQLDDESPERWTGDLDRILSLVSLFAENVDRGAMCAVIDDRIWALVRTPATRAREQLLELAAKVADRAERVLGASVLAGVGSSVAEVAEVPQSRRGAEQALAVLARRRPAGRAVHIDDVRSHASLLELLDLALARPALREGPAHALADHDARHGTRYRETLRAYLDRHGDVPRAAEQLGVHANTLRYRLRRLVEVAGLDLDDPDERIMIELELRLLEHAAR